MRKKQENKIDMKEVVWKHQGRGLSASSCVLSSSDFFLDAHEKDVGGAVAQKEPVSEWQVWRRDSLPWQERRMVLLTPLRSEVLSLLWGTSVQLAKEAGGNQAKSSRKFIRLASQIRLLRHIPLQTAPKSSMAPNMPHLHGRYSYHAKERQKHWQSLVDSDRIFQPTAAESTLSLNRLYVLE